MADAQTATFLVGGLMVLIGAVLFMAWSVWRYVDRARDMETLALRGVGHELRLNILQFLSELNALSAHEGLNPSALLPISHPQLDGLLSRPSEADRKALSVMRLNYDRLSANKLELRSQIAQKRETKPTEDYTVATLVQAITSLYLWEQHKGRPPVDAHTTRSWHVRDWMKAQGFKADLVPHLHLRDAVVEQLRSDGMALTPKPLNHTASEYYAKKYHRKSDPRSPFGRRRMVDDPSTDTLAAAPVKTQMDGPTPASPTSSPEPDAGLTSPIRVTYGPASTPGESDKT